MVDRPHRTAFGAGMLALATAGMALVLLPFWKAIFWAVVLGILFWAPRQALVRWLGGRKSLVSLLIVLLIFVFVLIPALLIAALIVDGAVTVVAQVHSGELQPGQIFEALSARFPKVMELLAHVGFDTTTMKATLGQWFASVAQFAVTKIAYVGQGASLLVVQAFLTLYVLFALLQNGDKIYQSFFGVLPLPHHSKERFFEAFSEMAVATIKGMIVVGVVQGILGGLIFWLLDVESAVFWGAMMALLSVVPPFGAAVVWVPAGVMVALNGNVFDGLILLAFGTVVISASDNLVRPIVVGESSSVPGYIVLVTTLGGLVSFGLTGLVLGPVIASLFLSAWQLFDEVEKKPSKISTEPRNGNGS